MNYRPNTKELTLWDTWMFPDSQESRENQEEGGVAWAILIALVTYLKPPA